MKGRKTQKPYQTVYSQQILHRAAQHKFSCLIVNIIYHIIALKQQRGDSESTSHHLLQERFPALAGGCRLPGRGQVR